MNALARTPSTEANRPWIVVMTHTGQERLAKYHLERQHFEVYMPLRLGRDLAHPFFPRHLFVRVSPEVNRWRALFSTIGVKHVFCRGDHPVGVRDCVIEEIRTREVGGFVQFGLAGAAACPWKPGDAVTVRGMVDAIFVERLDANRVTVLTKLLGERITTVDLSKVSAPQ